MGYRDARNFVTKERNKITSRQLSRCQTEKTFSVWIEFSLFNFSILNFEMRWSRVQPQTVNFRSILTLFVMHMRNFFSVSFRFFTKVSHDHFSPAIHWTIEEWIFRFCFHRSWLHRRWRRKPNKKLSSTSKLLLSFFYRFPKSNERESKRKLHRAQRRRHSEIEITGDYFRLHVLIKFADRDIYFLRYFVYTQFFFLQLRGDDFFSVLAVLDFR